MIPTRLYVKRHLKTGLMYFGKTTKDDVYSYTGSGKRWMSHIKKHGLEYIETVWVSPLFEDEVELMDFAIAFSEIFDIVQDARWANLREENGLDGAPAGYYVSEETRRKMSQSQIKAHLENKYSYKKSYRSESHNISISKALIGRTRTKEERDAISQGRRGIIFSEETKQKMSESAKRRPRKPHSEETKRKMSESAKARKQNSKG